MWGRSFLGGRGKCEIWKSRLSVLEILCSLLVLLEKSFVCVRCPLSVIDSLTQQIFKPLLCARAVPSIPEAHCLVEAG